MERWYNDDESSYTLAAGADFKFRTEGSGELDSFLP